MKFKESQIKIVHGGHQWLWIKANYEEYSGLCRQLSSRWGKWLKLGSRSMVRKQDIKEIHYYEAEDDESDDVECSEDYQPSIL